MSTDMASIYGFIDPRNDQLRYVGMTTASPRRRLSCGLSMARSGQGRTHLHNWLRQLLAINLRPDVFEIERVERAEAAAAEIFWIGYFRFVGANLCNQSIGGDGATGRKQPPEERARRSQRSWWRRATREERERHRASIKASGTIDKLIEHIHRCGAWNKGKKMPLGTGANLAKYVREHGTWNQGRKETRPEVLRHQSDAHKGKCPSHETILKATAARCNIMMLKTPEERSDQVKRAWRTRRERYGPSGGNA